MSSPDYRIEIALPAATVTALVAGGYALCTLFAVRAQNAAARPTVAAVTAAIMPRMRVEWSDMVQAYTSASAIVARQPVDIGFSAEIAPGQTCIVAAGGVGTVMAEGAPTAISLLNTTTTSFTCGLAHAAPAAPVPVPLCAAPLYGGHLAMLVPAPRVVLAFTTERLQPGIVVDRSLSGTDDAGTCSQLLAVTASAEAPRPIIFDINLGWRWGDFAWATMLPQTTDLVPLLTM